jgi:hypothetical protein
MPSRQLETVIDLLRGAPVIDGADVLVMRKNMETAVAAAPRPTDVALAPTPAVPARPRRRD